MGQQSTNIGGLLTHIFVARKHAMAPLGVVPTERCQTIQCIGTQRYGISTPIDTIYRHPLIRYIVFR